tara:strand:+ start:3432 stop:4418 length:987 start_codon:yes stop_codon:yes gene_type:complete
MAYRGGGSQIAMIRFAVPVGTTDPPVPFTCSCVSLALTESVFCDEFNQQEVPDYSTGSSEHANVSPPGNTRNFTGSYFHKNQKFRAYDDGRLTSFSEINSAHGNLSFPNPANLSVTSPNASHVGWDASTAPDIPFGGLMIKRPNCLCTGISKFKLTQFAWDGTAGHFGTAKAIGFEDGYGFEVNSMVGGGLNGTTLEKQDFTNNYGNPGTWSPKFRGMQVIGNATLFFTMRPNDDQTDTIVTTIRADELQHGDLVLKCTNTEGGNRSTGTACIKVVATSSYNFSNGHEYITQIETKWPKNEYAAVSMSACMMLENGVYIAYTPGGGTY